MDQISGYVLEIVRWFFLTFPVLNNVPAIWWRYGLNVLFALIAIVGLWLVYYCFRRGLGYEKFKGRWYSAKGIHNLKQELYTGVREGRLPDSETMAFLDKHIYGKTTEMRKLSGNGWL